MSKDSYLDSVIKNLLDLLAALSTDPQIFPKKKKKKSKRRECFLVHSASSKSNKNTRKLHTKTLHE